MSNYLATIFHGDVTLEQGSDITQFGWGDINISRKCIVNGTENSVGGTSGSLFVVGGATIKKTLHVEQDLNVLYGVTRLTETHIDTTNGLFTVTGGNSAHIQVDNKVSVISNNSDVVMNASTANVKLYAGGNSHSAVDILATDVAGGIKIRSGANSGVDIVAGSNGIIGTTSSGNVILTANGASGAFVVNTNDNNQNLDILLNNNTDSTLKIQSAGTNVLNTALIMNTTHQDGNIQISNKNGSGSGGINVLVGSTGFNLVTNTSGTISLLSRGAGSSYTVDSSAADQDFVISLNNPTDSSVIIKSDGANVTKDAIQIYTTNTAGNISLSQPIYSQGKVDISTGIGGFFTTTQDGGSIFMNTNSATSTYTNTTTADNQDLNITVTGNTNSKVNISSSGISNEAVKISTLNTAGTAGGIMLNASGQVQIKSGDTVNGVLIATDQPNIPVHIGTNNSTTTIYGNLDVKGLTTTIQSTTVTVDDNIIILNNAPSGTADGGVAIKRYQSANDSASGDVIGDIPDATGTVPMRNSDTATQSTQIYLSNDSSNVSNYYAGWWIHITGGTGQGQVRRIKSYNNMTKIATIYSTDEQTGILGNPQPVEGMDFTTVPDVDSTYSLYPCEFVMMIWDESLNEFAFVCSSLSPSEHQSIVHYSDLHINNLTSNSIVTNTINGAQADIVSTITMNNNSTDPVVITSFPHTYGIYLVFVKPVSESSRAHAIFMIGRVDAINYPGTVVRLISAKGVYGDQLDMQWPSNANPQIMYRPYPNGIGGFTDYRVKIVTL
jgi:hypothetical protein